MKGLSKILMVLCLGFMIVAVAQVGSYDIKEMTPDVKAALDGRRERNEQLRTLKAQGFIGENNHGYVQVLKPSSEAEALASTENKDRELIYKTIVAQNDLPADALGTVESVFAQVQRDKATTGDTLENESGQWITK